MWPPQAFKVGERVSHRSGASGVITNVRKSTLSHREWVYEVCWRYSSISTDHYGKMLTSLDCPEHTPCEAVLATASQTAICRCSFVGLGHDNGCEYVAAMEEAHNLLKDRE